MKSFPSIELTFPLYCVFFGFLRIDRSKANATFFCCYCLHFQRLGVIKFLVIKQRNKIVNFHLNFKYVDLNGILLDRFYNKNNHGETVSEWHDRQLYDRPES